MSICKKCGKEFTVWNQGINFAFDAVDTLYRDKDTYEKWTPAIQIIASKKAQGTKTEKLSTGIDDQSYFADKS